MGALKGDARALGELIVLPVRIGWWLATTTWIGGRTIARAVRFVSRLHRALSDVAVCPRGHETPLFGAYECACRAVHEGSVWGRCAVCGERAGWTPCVVCSLPIRSPFA